MALKITKASDVITVERLNVVIYGAPGLGKTSVAFTTERPLLLDFDQGSHRAYGRKDVVRVSDWDDVASMTRDDLEPFQTVIVDTAGRALDTLSADIIRANPKHGRGGALTLQGFGELKARFIAFLKLLNGFGKDVVLIAHMDEQRNGDEVIERLDVTGGSKQEIYKAADVMGRLYIQNGQRVLNFSPTDAAFGKNPGALDPQPVPHFTKPEFGGFLAGVIQQTKDNLNALTEDQRKAQEQIAKWRQLLEESVDAKGINELIPEAKKAGGTISAMLAHRATEIGLTFDKKAKAYVMPVQEAA